MKTGNQINILVLKAMGSMLQVNKTLTELVFPGEHIITNAREESHFMIMKMNNRPSL